MKCFRCFSFVLFALLGVFFGSFIINQNDTYALEDIEIIIDSSISNPGNLSICSNNCSSYKYVYLKFNNFDSSNPWSFQSQTIPFSLSWDNYSISTRFGIRGYSSLALFEIYPPSPNSVLNDITIASFYSQSALDTLSSNWSIDIIISETNPLSSGITPSGSIELTENGTYDVSQYAEAVVNVPETDCPPCSGGDYHNDLVAINNSIMICAATCLVIYFFYCIYRMIIKNSGVK